MKTTKFIALFLAILLALSLFAGCAEKPEKPDDPDTPDTPVEEPDQPKKEPDDYSDPEYAQEEVYDPDAVNKTFRVIGASMSDNQCCVIYGDCAVGATVVCTTALGDFSVKSYGGSFALRVKTEECQLTGVIMQKANDEIIGSPISLDEKVPIGHWATEPQFAALIGDNNQGFYQKQLPDYMHTNLLSEDRIQSLKEKFTERVNALKEFGCEMIVLISPNPMEIYPELVPDIYVQGEGISKLEQAKALLTEAGVTVLDETETFIAHKNDSLPLFYKTDTHWTDYGSYLAYVDLFNYISKTYPDAAPRKFNEFTWEWGTYFGGDMGYYFELDYEGTKISEKSFVRLRNFSLPDGIPDYKRLVIDFNIGFTASFNEEVKNYRSYLTDRETLPNIYVYRNSYGASIHDILAERTNQSIFNAMFTYTYNESRIRRMDADYVIYIMSEWEIDNILDN